jgi:hypothetical protein
MEGALAELRTAVMAAHDARAPLRLCGAGTKDFYGEACEGAPLDLTRYRGVLEYQPSELVLTARCGTPLSEIEALLAGERQFLAFESRRSVPTRPSAGRSRRDSPARAAPTPERRATSYSAPCSSGSTASCCALAARS